MPREGPKASCGNIQVTREGLCVPGEAVRADGKLLLWLSGPFFSKEPLGWLISDGKEDKSILNVPTVLHFQKTRGNFQIYRFTASGIGKQRGSLMGKP